MSKLDKYHDKRNFDKTPEPEGQELSDAGVLSFVVQKHAARRLHYDVRIEVEGVMPSWAVPKGPSYDPKIKRLAMHVEDHPLDYQTFEGIIPKGEYGGGAVIVWDKGTYRNITERNGQSIDVITAIKNGHLSIWFEGEKLKGGWSLTRTKDDAWIMVKRKDDFANPALDITKERPESVVSSRTVEQVAANNDGERKWTRGVATFRPPMLAELAKNPVLTGDWVYEHKLDGLRCVAVRNGDEVELWSRNHLSFNHRFPLVIDALKKLPVDNFVLDGELVLFDQGKTNFGTLQRSASDVGVQFHIFDILHLLENDTTGLSLIQRKELLIKLINQNEILHLVPIEQGTFDQLMERALTEGWEGLIAKQPESTYVSGRSAQWKKIKFTASQELVIGGWTDPKGARIGFGALLVGYYDETGFRFAGKVGSGFDHDLLITLHAQLTKLELPKSPFVDVVREKGSHWVKPQLVAEITFGEWTRDGKLRHPRFQGIREDKNPLSVGREG